MDPEISTIQNGGGEREEGQGQGAHARDQHWSGIKEVHKDLDQLSRDQLLGLWNRLRDDLSQTHGELAEFLLPFKPTFGFMKAFIQNFETSNNSPSMQSFDKIVSALVALKSDQVEQTLLGTLNLNNMEKNGFASKFFICLARGPLSPEDNVAELAVKGEKILENLDSLVKDLSKYQDFDLSKFSSQSILNSFYLLRLASGSEPGLGLQYFVPDLIRCMADNNGNKQMENSKTFVEYIQICKKKKAELEEKAQDEKAQDEKFPIQAFKFLAKYHGEEIGKGEHQGIEFRHIIKVKQAFEKAKKRVKEDKVENKDVSILRNGGGNENGRKDNKRTRTRGKRGSTTSKSRNSSNEQPAAKKFKGNGGEAKEAKFISKDEGSRTGEASVGNPRKRKDESSSHFGLNFARPLDEGSRTGEASVGNSRKRKDESSSDFGFNFAPPL